MVASRATLLAIYSVLQKHIYDDKLSAILADLQDVKGNHSFRETVTALTVLHEDELARRLQREAKTVQAAAKISKDTRR